MRKIFTFITATLISGSLLAGGLVTNTNQSASWVRLPSRNASVEADAVYYNPAGIMKMGNGFHFAVSNQTIFQKREITNDYSYLHNDLYEGSVKAPLFPSVAAAYKLDKFAVSFGFNPVGGGGGATYEAGLPSFEMSIADLVPATFTNFGTTDYNADIFFEGSSIYFGYQANVSYKINDMISVAAGVRLVTAKNTYNGYLRDISINPNYPTFGAYTGSMVLARDFFSDGAIFLNGLSTTATTLAGTINAAISGGTPAATPLSAMPAPLVAGVTQVLGAAGINATGMNIGTAAASLTGVAPVFTANATSMTGYAAATQDIEVDAEETGMSYTPILSVNITPIENLNIALKYEFLTKLELTTSLASPTMGGGIFIQDEKKRADMPAMLAIGAEYTLSKIKLALGANYYFDKSADYGHKIDNDLNPATPTVHVDNSEIIDNNGMTLGGGLEYKVAENWLVSAGYVFGNKGVNNIYQSDLTFGNATHTFGGGGAFMLGEMLKINLGASYTMYLENEKNVNHFLGATNMLPKETYTKSTFVVGVGVELSF